MAGNTYGFQSYPQQKSVAPAQVGAALMQMRQQPQPAPVPARAERSMVPDRSHMTDEQKPYTGLQLAHEEAAQRILSRSTADFAQPGAPGNDFQLAQLGLSPIEIRLLKVSGGAK